MSIVIHELHTYKLEFGKRSGDSYSSVGYHSSAPIPEHEEPLGVPFPGRTYTETGNLPNWVGYLVEIRNAADQPVLVYDYAVGGNRVRDVGLQVHREFLPTVGQKPNWAPWKGMNTLFSKLTIYLGNMCSSHGAQSPGSGSTIAREYSTSVVFRKLVNHVNF